MFYDDDVLLITYVCDVLMWSIFMSIATDDRRTDGLKCVPGSRTVWVRVRSSLFILFLRANDEYSTALM